jgi:acetylornithine deacetylase/succinyl-diaminopimelate desuccinylase-like protein
MTACPSSITELAVHLLRDLIRIDTTNPPGNETAAAQYMASVLRGEGFDPIVLEPAPGRGSVIARLHGSSGAGALLLMSHLDVVPAEAKEWDHPPFAAEVADGYIWGRGATDTKDLTAAQLAILLTLKREGVPLKRDIILAATADEEAGGANGMGWLVENHAPLLECDYAINEGGGHGMDLGGRRFYTCQTGEKGVSWMKLTARGTSGHGSMPNDDNAVAALCATVSRLAQARLPQHITPTVERLLRRVAETRVLDKSVLNALLDPEREAEAWGRMDSYPELVALLKPTLRNTVAPTMLQAGQKANVIPGEASAIVDGRIVPGQTHDSFLQELRPYIGANVQVEFIQRSLPYESEPASPLFDLMGQVLQEHDPGCVLAPCIVAGSTDGRMLAQKGVKVYGFAPSRAEPGWPGLEMAHARNERISLANVEFKTRVLYDVVRRFCT